MLSIVEGGGLWPDVWIVHRGSGSGAQLPMRQILCDCGPKRNRDTVIDQRPIGTLTLSTYSVIRAKGGEGTVGTQVPVSMDGLFLLWPGQARKASTMPSLN